MRGQHSEQPGPSGVGLPHSHLSQDREDSGGGTSTQVCWQGSYIVYFSSAVCTTIGLLSVIADLFGQNTTTACSFYISSYLHLMLHLQCGLNDSSLIGEVQEQYKIHAPSEDISTYIPQTTILT